MMAEYMEGIKNALVDYGAMFDDWKVEYLDSVRVGNSDIVYIMVGIIKKRCRKPFMVWNLKVDIVREMVYFDCSSFEYV